ncbi:MAG: molybdenum cofactor guanylyltransferase [Opitutales bacterium]
MTSPTTIDGVVLAGGRSSRMGRDKASLMFQGQTLLGRAKRALRPLCQAVYVSIRREQRVPREFEADRVIRDRFEAGGALAAIVSVLRSTPDRPWLVLACDLPHVEPELLEDLLLQRNPVRDATAFVTGEDGSVEPLCTLYEPSALDPLSLALDNGVDEINGALTALDLQRIPLRKTEYLRSVKNLAQYEDAFSQQAQTPNPFFGEASDQRARVRLPKVGLG